MALKGVTTSVKFIPISSNFKNNKNNIKILNFYFFS